MPPSESFWWVGFAVCAMPSLAVVAQPALAVAGDVAYLTRLLALVGQCVGVGVGHGLEQLPAVHGAYYHSVARQYSIPLSSGNRAVVDV